MEFPTQYEIQKLIDLNKEILRFANDRLGLTPEVETISILSVDIHDALIKLKSQANFIYRDKITPQHPRWMEGVAEDTPF